MVSPVARLKSKGIDGGLFKAVVEHVAQYDIKRYATTAVFIGNVTKQYVNAWIDEKPQFVLQPFLHEPS